MTTFELVQLVLLVLILIVAIVDLVMDVRSLPRKRSMTFDQIADEAIALAESNGRLAKKSGHPMTSSDKLSIALDWGRSRRSELGLKFTDADLRKRIELRLELGQQE